MRRAGVYRHAARYAFGAGVAAVALSATPVFAQSSKEPDSGFSFSGLVDSLKDKVTSLTGIPEGLTQPSLERFLPDPHPDAFGKYPRTIVIDFEGTLVDVQWSREEGWIIRKRPHVDLFLSKLFSLGYEIVIFSTNYEGTAAPVVNNFDKNGYVSHRLFRECLTYKNGSLVKDLDRLNRDLSRVLIIDHNKEAFGLHPDNAVLVKKWNDSSSEDAELLQLLPLLETVVKDDVRDVREIIRAFGNENTAIKFKEHLNTLRAQVQEEENEAKSSSWFGGLRASQRRTTAK